MKSTLAIVFAVFYKAGTIKINHYTTFYATWKKIINILEFHKLHNIEI